MVRVLLFSAGLLLANHALSFTADPLPIAPLPRLAGDREPPKAWKIADLNALLPNPKDPGEVGILVWQSIDYGGVLPRTDRCLILKRYAQSADGKTWALGYCLRYPATEEPAWKVWTIYQTGLKPDESGVIEAVEFYKAAPTDAEIAAFLKKFWWEGLSQPGQVRKGLGRAAKEGEDPHPKLVKYTPELTGGGICHAAWKKYLDREPPTKLFFEFARSSSGDKRP